MVHHCDEKIEKNNNVDHREASKHDEGPEPRELFDTGQFKIVEIDESKGCPEESLARLPEAGKGEN